MRHRHTLRRLIALSLTLTLVSCSHHEPPPVANPDLFDQSKKVDKFSSPAGAQSPVGSVGSGWGTGVSGSGVSSGNSASGSSGIIPQDPFTVPGGGSGTGPAETPVPATPTLTPKVGLTKHRPQLVIYRNTHDANNSVVIADGVRYHLEHPRLTETNMLCADITASYDQASKDHDTGLIPLDIGHNPSSFVWKDFGLIPEPMSEFLTAMQEEAQGKPTPQSNYVGGFETSKFLHSLDPERVNQLATKDLQKKMHIRITKQETLPIEKDRAVSKSVCWDLGTYNGFQEQSGNSQEAAANTVTQWDEIDSNSGAMALTISGWALWIIPFNTIERSEDIPISAIPPKQKPRRAKSLGDFGVKSGLDSAPVTTTVMQESMADYIRRHSPQEKIYDVDGDDVSMDYIRQLRREGKYAGGSAFDMSQLTPDK